MSVVHLAQYSAKHPEKFRGNAEDSSRILLPGAVFPDDETKPIVTSQSDVAIIGAGFSGLASALMLKKQYKTDNFVVFEKHSEWGGTWWANTYPGCASDIPALWYSIQAELNDNWSDLRPPQYEMEEYILTVVDKYNLRSRTKFETAVKTLTWDESSGLWKLCATNVKTGQRYEHTAKVVFSCQGGLVYPNGMDFPGLKDRFQGQYMHSALWDHSVDFKGKNVVVVGNGCSAAQVVPALMDDYGVKSLTQVFRSKHWIMPPHPSFLQPLYRWLSGSRLGLLLVRYLVVFGAESRYPLYQGNSYLSRFVRWVNTRIALHYIKTCAPEKFQKMITPDFKVGCKRLIFDYKYVPLLKNPIFDMTNSSIKEVTEDSVILDDGSVLKADIIVCCTGYDISRSLNNFQINGRKGSNLQLLWAKEGASAYKTAMPRDCPNMFFIAGPNSATGHASVVTAIENSVALAKRVMKPVLEGKAKSVCVKDSAYYKWLETTQERLGKAVFGTEFGGCVSWYRANGVNSTAYPYSQSHFWLSLRRVNYNDLEYEPVEDKKTV